MSEDIKTKCCHCGGEIVVKPEVALQDYEIKMFVEYNGAALNAKSISKFIAGMAICCDEAAKDLGGKAATHITKINMGNGRLEVNFMVFEAETKQLVEARFKAFCELGKEATDENDLG